jgi:uncharacterized protein YukE
MTETTFIHWEDVNQHLTQMRNRIEKLEAALREITDGQRDADKSYAELFVEVCMEARKALEGKNG